MDELTKSTKHIDGKEVTTTYAYDLNGNKMEITSNGTFKRYHYNKDNQLTSILTEEGSTDIYYDKNGNMRDILYVGGAKEHYEYDDYGQLVKVTNDKDKSYTYSYDAQGDRIRYQKKYSEAYDNDIWYDALSQTSFKDAKDLLDDKNSDQILASLRYQSQYRRKHGKCVLMKEENWNESDGDDWENKNIAYILDKSVEDAEVLATSTGEISIYGEGERLSTDSKTTDGIRRSIHYVNGNNNTVYGTATTENAWGDIRYRYKAIEYTDYGFTDDIKSGFSYNGEVQDETGLIYLRARYYNPVIGQFIQLDEHRGEKTSIESQNRYAYALNNPNKYIDKNGQAAMMMNDGGSGRRKSGGFAGGGRISGKFDVLGAIGSISKIASNAAEERKKALVSGSSKATKITKKEVPKPKRYTAETVCTTRPTPMPAPCPETAEQREARLDSLQHMLEFIGFAPGIGEVADGINAAIYYNRGKPFEALISAGCAVFPLVADAVLKPFLWAAGTVVEKVVKITQKIDGFLPSVRAGVSGLSKKLDYIPGFSKAKAEIKQICNKFCGYIDDLTVKVSEFIGKGTGGAKKIINKDGSIEIIGKGKIVEVIDNRPYLDPKTRPSFRKGVPEKTFENAKGPDGLVRDPLHPEKIINWTPGQTRKDVWDMGHLPEHKYSEMHKRYVNGELTPEEFRNWYNNPDNYRPELPSTNRSHLIE